MPRSVSPNRGQNNLHRESFAGIHDIIHTFGGSGGAERWLAVAYMGSGGCSNGSAKYGLLYSDDDGQTWTEVVHDVLRRSVAADSCDMRVYLTSGAAFSSGPNRSTPINNGDGLQILRSDMSVVQPVVRGGSVSNPDYRNPFGARVVAQNHSGVGSYVWVGVPGYGVMRGVVPTVGTDACEIQRGGSMSAHRVAEEASAPELPRTMFSIADARALVSAGRLELYDVSGRKARTPSSGVYFVLERSKAGVVTLRRTVVVTP